MDLINFLNKYKESRCPNTWANYSTCSNDISSMPQVYISLPLYDTIAGIESVVAKQKCPDYLGKNDRKESFFYIIYTLLFALWGPPLNHSYLK